MIQSIFVLLRYDQEYKVDIDFCFIIDYSVERNDNSKRLENQGLPVRLRISSIFS